MISENRVFVFRFSEPWKILRSEIPRVGKNL